MANLDVTVDSNLTNITPPSLLDRLLAVKNSSGELSDMTLSVLLGAASWIPVGDTWTYASATSITVPTDATATYQKGWGIRFKQGGSYKYMYITGVAATTLTVNGGTDYSVANAAITDVYYAPNPAGAFGFPAYFNYTVSITGGGGSAGTYAELIILEGKFSISGGRVSFQCSKQVTNKGSWTGNVTISMPVTPSSIYSGVFQGPPCWWANAGAASAPKAVLRLANGASLIFLDLINSSFFDWTELAVNDFLILDLEYWF
jgi:hypothetical protein